MRRYKLQINFLSYAVVLPELGYAASSMLFSILGPKHATNCNTKYNYTN